MEGAIAPGENPYQRTDIHIPAIETYLQPLKRAFSLAVWRGAFLTTPIFL